MHMPNETFVVVADGQKALFFRNEGDNEYPRLEIARKREHADPYDREIKTDAPGRSFSSVGSARSAMDEPDFHQQAEDRFAAATADLLRERALANDFDKLIIVAPPRTLGELRKHYHKEVEARLIGEIDKDLTGHPVDEIERIILAQI